MVQQCEKLAMLGLFGWGFCLFDRIVIELGMGWDMGKILSFWRICEGRTQVFVSKDGMNRWVVGLGRFFVRDFWWWVI
jgi:hypothetical protein